ncbi:GGDEF domain-containing protein [Streptomyces brasiliensis]|uniref:GGDEF domain-containing protein n=1 Tax=Streptomyces brasiliensis TaxID=1954 RepID=UPI001E3ED40A|nr:GGDEF domain-containing protein [Streptomyces brasiliensis]
MHGGILTRRLASVRRDPLTGLHTRAGWTARAEHCIRRHPHAAVLLVDLDHFKTLNDTHGHAAGDAALIATAHRLRAWCGRHGTAGRLGGDEFVAIVQDLTAADLDALTTALHRPLPYNGASLPLAASVGTCSLTELPVPALTEWVAAALAVAGGPARVMALPAMQPLLPSWLRTDDSTGRRGRGASPCPGRRRPCCHRGRLGCGDDCHGSACAGSCRVGCRRCLVLRELR